MNKPRIWRRGGNHRPWACESPTGFVGHGWTPQQAYWWMYWTEAFAIIPSPLPAWNPPPEHALS